jgi:hypothetical protein
VADFITRCGGPPVPLDTPGAPEIHQKMKVKQRNSETAIFFSPNILRNIYHFNPAQKTSESKI